MLQRAASNAYSWWWASHIRTKQSKWLEQNLQDMEEKVQTVLKLIEEDGDSFAKRAEMYYKKRPELIHFVEESYRAYRALAERYDHISTELQNANNTIAYVFPEQVQFAMEEEEDEASARVPKKSQEFGKGNVPKVPKIPKELKGVLASGSKKLQPKKSMKAATITTVVKSGLSKSEGLQEIDRVQKQILALQTEKEFVKSSYEGGLAKFWEIDQQIREMQGKVSSLQDEFGAGIVIEDDEARSLMASAALKSCQETLAQLQKKQEKSSEAAAAEHKRIIDAREKLWSLRTEFSLGQADQENQSDGNESGRKVEDLKSSGQELSRCTQERQDLEMLREKIKEHFEVGSSASLTVTELAENVDELVNKMINLEGAVSTQEALIQRLRMETDELQAQIRTLEDDKATLIDGKNDLSDKLREMQEKLHGLQDLNRSVENQNNNLQTNFTQARCNLDHLSEILPIVKPDEELQVTSQRKVELPEEFKGQEGATTPSGHLDEPPHSDSQNDLKYSLKSQEGRLPVEVESQEGLEDVLTSSGRIEKLKNLESQNEHMVPLKSQEQINGPEGLNPDDGLDKPHNVNTEKELKISDSSPMEEKSPHDGYEESRKVNPEEELKIPDSSPKEEKSPAELALLSQFKDPEELNDSDGSEKGMNNSTEKEKVEDDTSYRNHEENASQHQTSDEIDSPSEKFQNQKMEEKVDQQKASKAANEHDLVNTQEQVTVPEDEPDWKQLFMNGMENRETVFQQEYTTILRNYKEVKKKLGETDKASKNDLFDITVQLREMKSANAKKDDQIRILRQKLTLLQAGLGEDNEAEKTVVTESPVTEKEVTEDITAVLMDLPETSDIEDRFRMNIDEVLEENLDFWLRFSTAFHQIQKFETEVRDLQSELSKLEEKQKKQDDSSNSKYHLKSDAKPLYKHLREIHTELTVWLEKGMLLKDELKSRFSSLCDIQEEITTALKESAEDDDFKFTSYQAAKFQGEILNMKQENNKVADELQAGLDHVTTLQLEVEKALAKLNEEFKLAGSKHSQNIQLQHAESRSRVPLRSFIFGSKQKKSRHSIFSCMHPALHRKTNGLKLGNIV